MHLLLSYYRVYVRIFERHCVEVEMSREKFTPGPWHADWSGAAVLFPFVWKRGGYAIAKMCGKPKHPDFDVASERDLADPEKVKANAALIAAAPEMYAVLQHYVDLLEQANSGNRTAECKLFEDIALIEQVLKKALGEE